MKKSVRSFCFLVVFCLGLLASSSLQANGPVLDPDATSGPSYSFSMLSPNAALVRMLVFFF